MKLINEAGFFVNSSVSVLITALAILSIGHVMFPYAGYLALAVAMNALFGACRALGNKMDPRKSNGGVFLGLNGIVIKSHGGTDAEGFAYAVDLGYDMVRHELLAKIGHSLTRHHSEAVPVRAIGGAAS